MTTNNVDMLDAATSGAPKTSVVEMPDIPQIGRPRDVTLSTPLYDIKFKKAAIGNKMVDGTRGDWLTNMYSNLADKAIVGLATEVCKIVAKLVPNEDVAEGKVPSVNSFFDKETMEMLPEHAEGLKENSVRSCEDSYAMLRVLQNVLADIVENYDKNFPLNRGLQFAWASKSQALEAGLEKGGPIEEIEPAIRYRISVNKIRRDQIASAKAQANRSKTVKALRYKSVHALDI